MRLAVDLPPNWSRLEAEAADQPPTFARDGEHGSGALQVSIQAEYASGPVPNPNAEQLVQFAEGVACRDQAAELRGQSSGPCVLGQYGTVLARHPEYSWLQVWVLSNGRDFVLATHVSVDEPPEEEVSEASWIVKHLSLQAEADQ